MTEVQMIVTTVTNHVIEGEWETVVGTIDGVATGLLGTVANNEPVGIYTDDGVVVIPVRSVSHIRVRSREVTS